MHPTREALISFEQGYHSLLICFLYQLYSITRILYPSSTQIEVEYYAGRYLLLDEAKEEEDEWKKGKRSRGTNSLRRIYACNYYLIYS